MHCTIPTNHWKSSKTTIIAKRLINKKATQIVCHQTNTVCFSCVSAMVQANLKARNIPRTKLALFNFCMLNT